MTDKERFEKKFVKSDGCWEWMAYKLPFGYGRLSFAGRMQLAHRVAYQLYVGAVPEGLCVLHRCDCPSCVRPDHLFLGTDADNAHDRDKKGRGGWADASGEKNNFSKLTEEQVKMIRALRAAGTIQRVIAKEFGVAQRTISDVVRCHTWKNL